MTEPRFEANVYYDVMNRMTFVNDTAWLKYVATWHKGLTKEQSNRLVTAVKTAAQNIHSNFDSMNPVRCYENGADLTDAEMKDISDNLEACKEDVFSQVEMDADKLNNSCKLMISLLEQSAFALEDGLGNKVDQMKANLINPSVSAIGEERAFAIDFLREGYDYLSKHITINYGCDADGTGPCCTQHDRDHAMMAMTMEQLASQVPVKTLEKMTDGELYEYASALTAVNYARVETGAFPVDLPERPGFMTSFAAMMVKLAGTALMYGVFWAIGVGSAPLAIVMTGLLAAISVAEFVKERFDYTPAQRNLTHSFAKARAAAQRFSAHLAGHEAKKTYVYDAETVNA